VNRGRRKVVRRLPKLSLAVDAASHLVLAAVASTGGGGDQPFLDDLLYHAWRRTGGRVRCVVADAGYDSEDNHRIARLDLGVRSVIPPKAGRPTAKPPTERMRRNMYHRFKRRADAAAYGQRWQSETANSMIKRNLGSAMRARSAVGRRHELLLRVLTHNIMLLAEG
jgi:Transposase DDE domain